MSERSLDDFDEFAEDYRNIHTQNVKLSGADSFYFAEMKVRLLKDFETNQSFKVLDIGCGDGAAELFMQQYFAAWKVDGIDVSERSIKAAIKRNLSNALFEAYDGKHIPFENGSYDLVFMAGVLHHIAFHLHEGLIKEISRVLKKDGRLYLYEHNPLNPLTKYLVKTCVFDKNAKLLGDHYTCTLLGKNKLEVKNKNFIIFFPRKGFFSKLIFLEKYLQWLPLGGQYFIRAVKQF
jgi:SAM-dependent methyltransferase